MFSKEQFVARQEQQGNLLSEGHVSLLACSDQTLCVVGGGAMGVRTGGHRRRCLLSWLVLGRAGGTFEQRSDGCFDASSYQVFCRHCGSLLIYLFLSLLLLLRRLVKRFASVLAILIGPLAMRVVRRRFLDRAT